MLQDLKGFAEKTGFHPSTIRRIFMSDPDTLSRAIPMIYPSKTMRTPAETWLPWLSVEKTREVYLTSNGYNPKREALRTWISVCSTRKEIVEAYDETEDGSDEERFALAVMDEIFMNDLEKAPTLKEATDVLKDTPRESGVERAVFLRMYELYKKEEGVVAQ